MHTEQPRRPWAMAMVWHDLLFAHWPVPIAALRDRIPPELEIDTFGGEAWLGVVPFRMTGVRPRFTPAMPWLGAFAELNVRTYVRSRDGTAGVWFFSLDAANPVAVRVARRAFHLPYFDATMSSRDDGASIVYGSHRTHRGAPSADFEGSYRPVGPAYTSRPGELDDFLTNRLCLYAASSRGRVIRGDIAHSPWPLQPAEAEIRVNTMTQQIGLPLPEAKPLLHFARRLDVVAWRLRPI